MLLRIFLVTVLAACSQVIMARSLDVNLNSDTAEFRFSTNPSSNSRFGETEMDFGFLYTTDDDYMGMAGVQVLGDTGSQSPGLKAGVGMKVFGGNTDKDNDFLVVTLGGMLRYNPPFLDRFDVRAYINYAPKIVSFLDADNFSYYGMRAGYEIMQQAMVYVGYRKVKLDASDGPNETIDSGMNIGVEIYF